MGKYISRSIENADEINMVIYNLSEEVKKLNTFWVDHYNELKRVMNVAIGVRNAKINELKGKITTLENKLSKKLDDIEEITVLDERLNKRLDDIILISQRKLDQTYANLIDERLDKIEQTLESLQ